MNHWVFWGPIPYHPEVDNLFYIVESLLTILSIFFLCFTRRRKRKLCSWPFICSTIYFGYIGYKWFNIFFHVVHPNNKCFLVVNCQYHSMHTASSQTECILYILWLWAHKNWTIQHFRMSFISTSSSHSLNRCLRWFIDGENILGVKNHSIFCWKYWK